MSKKSFFMSDEEKSIARLEFYERHFGEYSEQFISTNLKNYPISFYFFPPNTERPFWVLISDGMSDYHQCIPPNGTPRTEILLFAREPQDWMLAMLRMMAEYPFRKNTYLNIFHTMRVKYKLTEPIESELTSMILVPSALNFFPGDQLVINNDTVRFLQLLPVTDREMEFALEYGAEKLFEIFINEEVPLVIDEKRKSII